MTRQSHILGKLLFVLAWAALIGQGLAEGPLAWARPGAIAAVRAGAVQAAVALATGLGAGVIDACGACRVSRR